MTKLSRLVIAPIAAVSIALIGGGAVAYADPGGNGNGSSGDTEQNTDVANLDQVNGDPQNIGGADTAPGAVGTQCDNPGVICSDAG